MHWFLTEYSSAFSLITNSACCFCLFIGFGFNKIKQTEDIKMIKDLYYDMFSMSLYHNVVAMM